MSIYSYGNFAVILLLRKHSDFFVLNQIVLLNLISFTGLVPNIWNI